MSSASTPAPAFSFRYGGVDSMKLLPSWIQTASDTKQEWTDPATGFRVSLEATTFDSSSASEWVLWFENTGPKESAILSDVHVLDRTESVVKPQHSLPELIVGRSKGSTFAIDDFEYQEDRLFATDSITFGAGRGRPSQHWLPFYLLDFGGYGSFFAVGWSGQWTSTITHSDGGEISVTAGMERLEASLEPGERIRSPRILQMNWTGDRAAAHNKLRRFLLEHHTPRIDGKPVTGLFTMGAWGALETAEQVKRLKLYGEKHVRQQYFWIDAGWYGSDSSYSPDEFEGDWADYVGDWSVNLTRHPDGLGPIREAAADAGMKFLLWVEPGRAIENTPLVNEHPDWFLGDGRIKLLNWGDPSVREGATDFFSNLITESKVDLFREDYNLDPLPYWVAADVPGRVGLAEAHYVEGFYWFWDELLRRHPGLIIDNCASGGRRIELETISRSTVLWRSDWQCFPDADPEGGQSQFMGLSLWIPVHGAGLWASMPTKETFSEYRIRSTYGPSLQMSAFVRGNQPIADDYPWDDFLAMSDEYLRAQPYFSEDFYPLVPMIDIPDQRFVAYQMDSPSLGGGIVMAYRRRQSPFSQATFQLHGLDESATYEVQRAGQTQTMSGAELRQGITVQLDEEESSQIIFYERR